jgi:exocyst complex component 4
VIEKATDFMEHRQFNPVDLAIQLLDESSMGKDIDSFRRTKIMLSKALKGSVDSKYVESMKYESLRSFGPEHYQAFAASLPHHASLLSHLDASSTQIKDMRTSLQEAKENLGNKRADLMQLWTRGQTVEEMIKLLDEMYFI